MFPIVDMPPVVNTATLLTELTPIVTLALAPPIRTLLKSYTISLPALATMPVKNAPLPTK